MNIAIILTCFNRKEKTIESLKAVKKQFHDTNIEYDIHLTDDGCTDGTSEAVKCIFPNAYIYKGENLYWAGGMRLAWKSAYIHKHYDYFLFLNDDTIVNDNIIHDFLECHKFSTGNAIISGAICDPLTKEKTYTGFKIDSLLPFRSHLTEPNGKPQKIDYSGANIMFIPKIVVDKIGFFPKIYVHGIADIDYCLRAKKKGFSEIMTSNYVGFCSMNEGLTNCNIKEMTFRERYNYLFSPKGKASVQWIYFQWNFFPWRTPLVISKIIAQLLFGIKE